LKKNLKFEGITCRIVKKHKKCENLANGLIAKDPKEV